MKVVVKVLLVAVAIIVAVNARENTQGVLQHETMAETEAVPSGKLTTTIPASVFDAHHTNKYLTNPLTFFALRRAASFDVNLCFQSKTDGNKFPTSSVALSFTEGNNGWDLKTAAKTQGNIPACPAVATVTGTIGDNFPWGKYDLNVAVGDGKGAAVSYTVPLPVYVIFNPYSSTDADVYLPDASEQDEYVQSNIAYVWHGTEENQRYSFDLGQHSILPIIYDWATMKIDSKKPCESPRANSITLEQRRSAYQTLRFFAPLFQSPDEYANAKGEKDRKNNGCHGYLLIGRWGYSRPARPADYATNPVAKQKHDAEMERLQKLEDNWYWQTNPEEKKQVTLPWNWGTKGIAAIFNKFKEQSNMPVRFAQCFIYSAVTTATGRSLGIPIRPVSTLSGSCHPSHHTPFALVNKNADDTIAAWNFHVWTDAYVANPIGSKKPEWNAFDGNTVNGPIPLKYIRENVDPSTLANQKDQRDLKEFIGETKATYWQNSKKDYNPKDVNLADRDTRYKGAKDGWLGLARCGNKILTKKVGCFDPMGGIAPCANENELLNYKQGIFASYWTKPTEEWFLEEEETLVAAPPKEEQKQKKPGKDFAEKKSPKQNNKQNVNKIPSPVQKGEVKRAYKVVLGPVDPKVGQSITATVVKQIEKASLQIAGPVVVEAFVSDYTNRISIQVHRSEIPPASFGGDITKAPAVSISFEKYRDALKVREVRYFSVKYTIPLPKRNFVIKTSVELRTPKVRVVILDQKGENPFLKGLKNIGAGIAKIANSIKTKVTDAIKQRYPGFKFDDKGKAEIGAAKTFDVEVSFKNPFNFDLTKGTLVVRDGNLRKHKFDIPKVAAGAIHKQVVKNVQAGVAKAGGPTTRLIRARYNFAGLHDFSGDLVYSVPDQSARQDVKVVASPVQKRK